MATLEETDLNYRARPERKWFRKQGMEWLAIYRSA